MRVNSYAMFGDKRANFAGSIALNIRQHYSLYPDWTFWVLTDKDLDDKGYCGVLKKLVQEGLAKVSVVAEGSAVVQQRSKCVMMLWRLLPIWEDTEYVFCRDLDSILTPRQLKCVREFIASGKIAHGITDNVNHDIALMGGMCGFKSKGLKALIPNLSTEVQSFQANWNAHGTDQNFLMQKVWPLVQHSSLIHRLTGPNRRSHLKDVAHADVSDINGAILDRGDDFCNYIGAADNSSPDREIVDFYNEHGNKEKCRIISQIEKDLNYNI